MNQKASSPKKNILLIYGGQSAEHDVSKVSGGAIFSNLDRELYEVHAVGILPNTSSSPGAWKYLPVGEANNFLRETSGGRPLPLDEKWENVYLLPGTQPGTARLVGDNPARTENIDMIFPILHGPFGEDGRLQGLLEMYSLPFTGCGMYASALCMDKVVFKDYLAQNGFRQTEYFWLDARSWSRQPARLLEQAEFLAQDSGLFVKPARMGSSVGISRVPAFQPDTPEAFEKAWRLALDEAFQYDTKIVVEKNTSVRELEYAVLGNEAEVVAGPGEIRTDGEFYDFENKYGQESRASLILESDLPEGLREQGANLARDAYLSAGCQGFARVDLFLSPERGFMVNEINTLPGFTPVSMYPVLIQQTGRSYSQLLTEIIEAGFARDPHR